MHINWLVYIWSGTFIVNGLGGSLVKRKASIVKNQVFLCKGKTLYHYSLFFGPCIGERVYFRCFNRFCVHCQNVSRCFYSKQIPRWEGELHFLNLCYRKNGKCSWFQGKSNRILRVVSWSSGWMTIEKWRKCRITDVRFVNYYWFSNGTLVGRRSFTTEGLIWFPG